VPAHPTSDEQSTSEAMTLVHLITEVSNRHVAVIPTNAA